MEEYRPLAADGAAPDGQTRLPWGDESPTVTVETPAPVGIEAHPPEPITHFAAPEATFFTAEPPAHEFIEADENGHRDADDGEPDEPDEPEQAVSEEPDDDVPDDEAAAEPDAIVDEELETADWVDEPVDDVWSDDDAWAPPSPSPPPPPPALDAED